MKKIAMSLAVASMLTGSAFADKNCPIIASDGTGDFLIAPAFFATADWSTDLKVINTSLDHSVIARVVVRDGIKSDEFDFHILLSPSDVWTGNIKAHDNSVYIFSDDDSNEVEEIKKGFDMPKQLLETGKDGINFSYGYVEIYPVAMYDEESEEIVSKSVLRDRFTTLRETSNQEGYDSTGAMDVGNDIISGFVTLKHNKATMSLPMLALENTSDKKLYGDIVNWGKDTNYLNFFELQNSRDINRILQKDTVTIPYTNRGDSSQVIMTAINDYTSDQKRIYSTDLRNEEEGRVKCIVSPCKIEDEFTMDNEVSLINVKNIVEYYENQKQKSIEINLDNGALFISNIKNTGVGQQINKSEYDTSLQDDFFNPAIDKYIASVIPTYMQVLTTSTGEEVTNWMYLPFSYSNPELIYANRECGKLSVK